MGFRWEDGPADELLGEVDGGFHPLAGAQVLPVEVFSREVGAVVPWHGGQVEIQQATLGATVAIGVQQDGSGGSPLMTPSGFIMGTTLKMYMCRSSWASGESPVM